MHKRLSNIFHILLILVPVVFVFISFFKLLHLVWGDAPFYYPEGLKELVSGIPIWSQNGTDFGGRNLALWLSPLMVIYGSLNKYFGFGNDAIIRILFYFPSVILAGLGPYFLTKHLKLSKNVQFFSSLFYLLNTYFILLIDGGQVGVALAYGIFPFVILFWKKFFDGITVNKFALAFFVTFILCYVDPRIAILSFLLIFLWQILEGRIKDLLWMILAGMLLIPVNAFWLLPLIKGGAGGLSTSVTELQLSSLLNSLFLFAPHWPSNIFGNIVSPYFYFSLIPIMLFGGFLFKKTDKRFYVLSIIFLFFAFLAKGSTPPLGNWYEIFVNKIPFGSVFRDSSKFFIPMFLLGGILIGNTVDSLSNLFRNIYLKWFVFSAVYLYLLILIFPAIVGTMNFNLSARNGSSDDQIIYEHLRQESDDFRTLRFNEKPQTAFETANKPALSADQLTTFRPFASINEGEDAYNFLNNPNFIDWLRVFGVRYVILSGNPRNIYPTQTDIKNWSEENKLISQASGLIRQDWGTQDPVFRIDNIRPATYSTQKLALVVGADLPSSEKMPGAVYAEDGKFDPTVLTAINPNSLKIIFNQGNSTDLAMSFLQKYFKSPTDAQTSQWAEYSASQYLKVKYELLIRGYKFNDFDYGKGLAFSTKNGESVKYSFSIPTDGNYVIAKRTGTNQNQKLTWSLEKKELKAGNFEYEVKNESGTEVVNVVAVIPESEVNIAAKLAEKYISTFGVLNDFGSSISEWHDVTMNNPGSKIYKYKIIPGDNWLIYTQNYDSNWVSDASSIHLPVFSMINGFYLGNSNQVTVKFSGQKYLDLGAKVSLGSILVLLVSYLAYAICKKDSVYKNFFSDLYYIVRDHN